MTWGAQAWCRSVAKWGCNLERRRYRLLPPTPLPSLRKKKQKKNRGLPLGTPDGCPANQFLRGLSWRPNGFCVKFSILNSEYWGTELCVSKMIHWASWASYSVWMSYMLLECIKHACHWQRRKTEKVGSKREEQWNHLLYASNVKCHPCKKLECQRTSTLARSHFIQGALTDNTRYPHTCKVWLQEQFLLVKNTYIAVHQARCFRGASKPRCNRFEWCFQRIEICHLARSCLD